MELIKNWALSVCTVAIVITVAQILIPKGNVNKTLEMVLRIFLLSVLVSPILFDVDFKVTVKENFQKEIERYSQSLESDMNSMLEDELALQIEEMIRAQLSEIDVTANEIEVKVVAVGNKEAEIENVSVRLNSTYKIKETDIRYVIAKIVRCEINIKYVEDI